MSVKHRIGSGISASALTCAALAISAAPALAGSGGQQIDFIDSLGVANTIRINGYNQNGSYTSQCFATPVHENKDYGYWWAGTVNVIAYSGNNCQSTTVTAEGDAYIPTVQSGDWTVVSDAGWPLGNQG